MSQHVVDEATFAIFIKRSVVRGHQPIRSNIAGQLRGLAGRKFSLADRQQSDVHVERLELIHQIRIRRAVARVLDGPPSEANQISQVRIASGLGVIEPRMR